MQGTLATLATKVSPTVLAKVLAYKTPEGEEPFHKGMPNKSFGEQIFANDPKGIKALLDSNKVAYTKYLKEEREREVNFTRESAISEAQQILIDNPDDLVGFKSRIDLGRTRLRAMGETTEKLDRMAEFTATPSGIQQDIDNINNYVINGDYDKALTYIEKSGNPMLNKFVDKLTTQKVARDSEEYKTQKTAARTLVEGLVTLNNDQKDVHGRPDVAAVQNDLGRFYEASLSSLIEKGTPPNEAIFEASQLTQNYWLSNGGGQKTSQKATGKFVYNDQGGMKVKGRANKGGFDKYITWKKLDNEFNVDVGDLRRFNMELKSTFGDNPDIRTLEQHLNTAGSVLDHQDFISTAQAGKYTPEVLWKSRKLGIPPLVLLNKQLEALRNSEDPLDKEFVKKHRLNKLNLPGMSAEEDVYQYLQESDTTGAKDLQSVMNRKAVMSPNQLKRMAIFKDVGNVDVKRAIWPELDGTANEGLLATRNWFDRDKYLNWKDWDRAAFPTNILGDFWDEDKTTPDNTYS